MQAKQLKIQKWFEDLQIMICRSLEAIEQEYEANSAPQFEFKSWMREDLTQQAGCGGGGKMGLMKGQVFEKAGVNFSQVQGEFSKEFRDQIPGATGNGQFWASGVSLVIHPMNPLVPAIHLNTRMIVTEKAWFGGGSDLTPTIEYADDTNDFHKAFHDCCNRHDEDFYPKFKKWCDDYFYLPHRHEARGIGGIFYDYLYFETDDIYEKLAAFTKDVGKTFNSIYPELVRRHMFEEFSNEDKEKQYVKRGRYAEFNLLYDRGTQFGLKTGGNTEAILMSLPPMAKWP